MSLTWGVGIALWLAWWIHTLLLRRDLKVQQAFEEKTIAEVQKLKKRLAIRLQHLDQVMDAIQEIVFRLDQKGMVMALNQRARAAFNLSEHLALPQPMVMIYRDSDWLESLQEGIQQLPNSTDLPKLFIKKRVYLPRLSNLGKNQSVLLCIDVTKEHQLQEQRKAFTANLMHDLKTPLTSLLGYARSIEAFYDDEAICRESASVIAQEAKHVNELLNSLLSVEQIEYSGSADAHCDMVPICQQVWQSLAGDLEHKGLTLHLTLPKTCTVAMQDVDVYRIIVNIATNAIRYTEEDTNIYCHLDEHLLVIEDEGPGVSEKDLPHLCERFYRVDAVRSQGSGHGLGLAIVKETLARDGGKLSLKNRAEGGLQVSVKLPVFD